MSLAQKLNDFAQAVALDVKALFGRSLPSGGLTGQVLAKTSGADYAVSWQNSGGGGGSSIQQVTVNIPTAKKKDATVTVSVPGVTNTAVVSAFAPVLLAPHTIRGWTISLPTALVVAP